MAKKKTTAKKSTNRKSAAKKSSTKKSPARPASSKVDAYIARSADFARPILQRIRKLFHKACPRVEETIKWGCPHFDYKGMLGGMAAFKKHVSFGFWKSRLLSDPHNLFADGGKASMCTVKVTSVAELPPAKVLIQYIKEAVALNEQGVKTPRAATRAKKRLRTPPDLAAALESNKRARATFDSFSSSRKNEYIEWLTEAKQDATRKKRLATAVAWMAEGKPRNWKYIRKK